MSPLVSQRFVRSSQPWPPRKRPTKSFTAGSNSASRRSGPSKRSGCAWMRDASRGSTSVALNEAQRARSTAQLSLFCFASHVNWSIASNAALAPDSSLKTAAAETRPAVTAVAATAATAAPPAAVTTKSRVEASSSLAATKG